MNASLLAGFIRLLTGANVRWTGCLPDTRQRIYFANHTSNLDSVVLWSVLPPQLRRRTRPVAARDYWSSGFIRPFLAKNIFNAVLIERIKVTAHNNPLHDLFKALDENFSLIIFPEGGRQSGPDLGRFKSGLYHLAKDRPNVELIPIYIDNMNRILPKGEVLPVPLLTCLSFGAPLHLEPNETRDHFLERARAAVNALHNP